MTESLWFQCTNPLPLLEYLPRSQQRKLRLLACAICRTFWMYLHDPKSKSAVEVAEQFADGLVSNMEFLRMFTACFMENEPIFSSLPEKLAAHTVWCKTASATPGTLFGAREAAMAVCTHLSYARSSWSIDDLPKGVPEYLPLLHEIFGNPFRKIAIAPAWQRWNQGTVVQIAQHIYEDRELPSGHLNAGALAILADALIDASCTNEDILAHLRSPGPHVRGCWVVDLILGKS